jgi:hypothetical protein
MVHGLKVVEPGDAKESDLMIVGLFLASPLWKCSYLCLAGCGEGTMLDPQFPILE